MPPPSTLNPKPETRNPPSLLNAQPDDKYEDPKDVAAMEMAKKHMGDYKLKTADDYKVTPTRLHSPGPASSLALRCL